MSEENVIDENLEVEELSTEDKKKAINLQDLVYVKKYIDDRHYSKSETDSKIETEINTAKEEINKDVNAAIEASNKSYSKEESDDRYYKKTDTVANANIAQYASSDTSKGTIEERLTNLGFREDSASITGSGLGTVSKNSLTRIGNYVFVDIEFTVGSDETTFDNISIQFPENFRPNVFGANLYIIHDISKYFEATSLMTYAAVGYYDKQACEGTKGVSR